MSHRCGQSCRRKNGLGKCETCKGYGSSRSRAGNGAAAPHYAGALRAYHPTAPPSVTRRVCNLCGAEFSNYLGAPQHYCRKPTMTTEPVVQHRCLFCGAICDGEYCGQHLWRAYRPPPKLPPPELTPGEYAEWCMELAEPVFQRLQTIPRKTTEAQECAIAQDFARSADLYRIAIAHTPDGVPFLPPALPV